MESDDRRPLLQPGPSQANPPAYSPHEYGAANQGVPSTYKGVPDQHYGTYPAGAAGAPAGAYNPSGAPAGAYNPSGAPAGAYNPTGVPAGAYNPQGYQPLPGDRQPTYILPGAIVVQPREAQPSVVVVGGCPACRVGVLEDDFTCLGVCLGILFFPIGILCCIAMRQRRCPNCGAIFG